ncbi:MAG: S24/S26 family peptidase [Clostridia bacterium]|nr:S24/S26 family peptidase [Clostridia bacterium]
MSATIEEVLARDGIIVYKTRGVSMEPMLRQNRDLVTIRVPDCRLKRFDVALYRRGDDHVLHRVIKVKEDYYIIRGDNTFSLETVPDDDVIGVLTGFIRKGKEHSVTERGYRFYARIWNGIYPIRSCWVRLRRLAGKAAHRLGIRRRKRKTAE